MIQTAPAVVSHGTSDERTDRPRHRRIRSSDDRRRALLFCPLRFHAWGNTGSWRAPMRPVHHSAVAGNVLGEVTYRVGHLTPRWLLHLKPYSYQIMLMI